MSPSYPLIKRCHLDLKKNSRCCCNPNFFNLHDETMTWLGVGNVDAQLFHRDLDSSGPVVLSETICSAAGFVGYHLPSLRAAVISVVPGDVVILSTDGIYNFFAPDLNLNEPAAANCRSHSSRHAKGTDDALVLVPQVFGKTRPSVDIDMPARYKLRDLKKTMSRR